MAEKRSEQAETGKKADRAAVSEEGKRISLEENRIRGPGREGPGMTREGEETPRKSVPFLGGALAAQKYTEAKELNQEMKINEFFSRGGRKRRQSTRKRAGKRR